MEELFELLASTNGTVSVDFDSIISINDEIVSTEKFLDGLKIYFENYTEYFISSIYNQVLNKSVINNLTVFQLFDTVHNLEVTIKVYE